MIRPVLLGILFIILLCICCAGVVIFWIFNQGISISPVMPTARESATITHVQVPSATTTPVASATPMPVLPGTATPTLTETVSGGDTFLPFQSSTNQEVAACLHGLAKVQSGTVRRVIDGDTIDVLIDGEEQRVRYIGIDSPEMDFPLGAQAQAENMKLVDGRDVLLFRDVSDVDQYQRLLRYVMVEDGFVNYELVRSGYAMSKGYDPDTACQELFDGAEEEAKAAGLGLWAPTPTPIPGSASAIRSIAGIVIQNIFYDGRVKRVESDEYAEIANTGSTAFDLTGWRLNAGNPGQDFVFPSYTLNPGETCRVYTNETHAESGGFSFASRYSIWNNQGDCGYLFDPEGTLIDDYCY